MTTEPVTLEQKDILHILRNPWGKTEDEKRRARLEGADEIERLQRSYECAHAQAMENGLKGLQAVHERDCAVEDVKRLSVELAELRAEAVETVQHWGGYVSDYFREKHDLAGDIKRLRGSAPDVSGSNSTNEVSK